MKIPFLALIIQGIPEQIAIVALAFVIAKIPLDRKKIILIGFIMAFSSYLVRMLPVTFGIHTIMVMGILFMLLTSIGKGNLNTTLVASLVSALSIIVIETICLSLLMPLFGVTSEVFFTNTTVRILITLPQVFVTFLLALTIYKIRNHKKMS